MADQREREKLFLEIMHRIAEKFKNKAVLKGGMYLRLLNSPRYTQDLDYVFTGKPSRRETLKEMSHIVETLEGVKIVKSQLNSRGLIVTLEAAEETVLLEISVTDKTVLPPDQMTTFILANQYHMSGRVITVLNAAEAYSHKIAAALERNTMRDLYDITIYQSITDFDRATLQKRLERLSINRAKPQKLSLGEAAALLRKKMDKLDQDRLKEELYGVVPADFLKGGVAIIKNSISRLASNLAP